jgi:hypothetical protein
MGEGAARRFKKVYQTSKGPPRKSEETKISFSIPAFPVSAVAGSCTAGIRIKLGERQVADQLRMYFSGSTGMPFRWTS